VRAWEPVQDVLPATYLSLKHVLLVRFRRDAVLGQELEELVRFGFGTGRAKLISAPSGAFR
jgi:hypothetical protein